MVTGLPITESNLILTGYIEPNKPRIGRQVAERLKMPFVDVEEHIEQRVGDKRDRLREFYGERHLRAIEQSVMEEIVLHRQVVLRVSGSTLMHNEHYEQMQRTGVMVCLVARLDSILQGMHLMFGTRYHDPHVRGAQLGHLRREWQVRKKPGLHEVDATYLDEPALIEAIITLWQTVSIQRI